MCLSASMLQAGVLRLATLCHTFSHSDLIFRNNFVNNNLDICSITRKTPCAQCLYRCGKYMYRPFVIQNPIFSVRRLDRWPAICLSALCKFIVTILIKQDLHKQNVSVVDDNDLENHRDRSSSCSAQILSVPVRFSPSMPMSLVLGTIFENISQDCSATLKSLEISSQR